MITFVKLFTLAINFLSFLAYFLVLSVSSVYEVSSGLTTHTSVLFATLGSLNLLLIAFSTIFHRSPAFWFSMPVGVATGGLLIQFFLAPYRLESQLLDSVSVHRGLFTVRRIWSQDELRASLRRQLTEMGKPVLDSHVFNNLASRCSTQADVTTVAQDFIISQSAKIAKPVVAQSSFYWDVAVLGGLVLFCVFAIYMSQSSSSSGISPAPSSPPSGSTSVTIASAGSAPAPTEIPDGGVGYVAIVSDHVSGTTVNIPAEFLDQGFVNEISHSNVRSAFNFEIVSAFIKGMYGDRGMNMEMEMFSENAVFDHAEYVSQYVREFCHAVERIRRSRRVGPIALFEPDNESFENALEEFHEELAPGGNNALEEFHEELASEGSSDTD